MSDEGSTPGVEETARQEPTATESRSDLAALDRRLQAWFTWYPIAKKEFYDTIRSRTLHVLSVFFGALFVLSPALAVYTQLGQRIQQQEGVTVTTNSFIPPALGRIASVIVPIIAIAVTYAAIAGERERGSLKLLLSLPYERLQVVLGKLAGRSVVVAVPLVLSLLISALVFLPSSIAVKPVGYLVFAGLTGLLAVVFVAFATGVSAWARSTLAAMFGTIGAFVYVFALWNANANGIGNLLAEYGGASAGTVTRVKLFVKLLNPTQAYQTLLRSLVAGQSELLARVSMIGGPFSGEQGLIARQIAAKRLGDSVPLYLSDGAAVAVLVVWLVVPLALGYRAFDRSDL